MRPFLWSVFPLQARRAVGAAQVQLELLRAAAAAAAAKRDQCATNPSRKGHATPLHPIPPRSTPCNSARLLTGQEACPRGLPQFPGHGEEFPTRCDVSTHHGWSHGVQHDGSEKLPSSPHPVVETEGGRSKSSGTRAVACIIQKRSVVRMVSSFKRAITPRSTNARMKGYTRNSELGPAIPAHMPCTLCAETAKSWCPRPAPTPSAAEHNAEASPTPQ